MLAIGGLAGRPARIEQVARFAAVGTSGLVVNTVVLALATGVFGVHYVIGTILATQASTVWNFAGSERLVFASDHYHLGLLGRFVRFAAINNAVLLVRGPFVVLLTEGVGVHYLVSNVITLGASFLLRYVFAERVVWRVPVTTSPPTVLSRRGDVPVESNVGVASGAVAALAVVGVVATVGMRLWAIGAFGYNSDEAVYAGQGLTLVGDPILAEHFSLFRAHPLILQLVVGVAFQLFGTVDTVGRVTVAVLFGMGSVAFSYLLAARLYGRRVAMIAALVLAVLPYHVVVSRQVMVDTPMGFFIVVCVWLVARYVTGGGGHNLVGAFVALGLAALSKEVAVLGVVPLGVTLFAHQRWSLLRERALWAGALLFLVVIAPFPATRLINDPSNAGSFFLFQIFRSPNHPPDYFLRVLLQFTGPVFLALCVIGMWVLVRRRNRVDMVILPWLATFFIFFNVWPTKLFAYLFPILPMMAIAMALGLVRVVALAGRVSPRVAARPAAAFLAAGVVVAATLSVGTASTIGAGPAAQVPGLVHFDIEVQTFAGGREIGEWIGDNTPANARLLTIGPSMGNIVRFYGDRDSAALSVSPDPRKRNPAYVPVINPDLAIRNMDLQYALWDAYSADRSAFYNARLMRYVRRYQGVPVFSVFIDAAGSMRTIEGPAPEGVLDVRLVLYDLAGGNPIPRSRYVGAEP